MKLTSKGRYAVMAMADLAKINANQPTNLTDISFRQGISLSFLEQIFSKLKKNNLVQSSRGPSGGYLLTKRPEEIKLSSIINAVDEKVKTVGCKKESKKGCTGKAKQLALTFKKMARNRKKAADGGYMGPSISGNYGGKNLSNPSYRKYYKGMI